MAKKLYAIQLTQPSEPFIIKGASKGEISSVRLLGAEAKVRYEITAVGLKITPPAYLGLSKYAWTFEIVTSKQQHTPNAIVIDRDKALKGTKKVDLEGKH